MPLHPDPETLHVTFGFEVFVTVAVNSWPVLMFNVADVGDTVTVIGGGVSIVTEAAADLVLSACEVAVTVTVFGLGAVLGAVYRPAADTDPQVVPLQPGPDTLHVTAVFVVFVTDAVNDCVAPVSKVALVGTMLTPTNFTVTEAVADFVLSACDVAVTITVFGLGAAVGAV